VGVNRLIAIGPRRVAFLSETITFDKTHYYNTHEWNQPHGNPS